MPADPPAVFRADGYLHLPGLLRAEVAPLRREVADALSRLRIWSGGKVQPGAPTDLPVFQQTLRLGQMVRPAALPKTMAASALLAAVAALAGPTTAIPAQLLLSLPKQSPVSLARLGWHVDVRAARFVGVQAFVLVDDVAPGGGATLALAGSHRVDTRAIRADVTEDAVHALGLRVLEMSGRAGDVYLMDLRLLHAPSPNQRGVVRMMATSRFFTPDGRAG